ncbi:MAG: phosphoenolpyruvate carboxykinase (GTP) [Candidatus Omnitrophota bacterium]
MATPLGKWVEEQARLTRPARVYWCDGSEEEARRLVEIGEKEERIGSQNVFYKLNQETFPLSYLHRSHPTDVARTEQLTFVCHPDRETVGPNNNWMDPLEAKAKMRGLSEGCMAGRTMYVLPYMMGNPLSPYAKACVQLTDISYVAVSMRIMTRLGKDALDRIGASENFVKGIHSVGDFDPTRRFIMHFPEDNLVWSIGSGYGGNALLGKKCFSLRIASWMGLKEGWLAEHMVIIGVEDPKGNVAYLVAALPSACGKTNLAMMESVLPGYKIWTLGDDIAWLHVGEDGRLYALNPESGFFGVAPGTSLVTNPNMMMTLKAGTSYPTLYTNTALNTDTNEPWWEGMDGSRPENLLDWQGNRWSSDSKTPAAHPNSRFTVDIRQCPVFSPEADNPQGVPISAIIFGGRRSDTRPLVLQSFNWQHGVFMAAMMGSETTAAAAHQVGILRRDPMAMLPFCGYNMGDYFRHWLNMGKRMARPPEIFCINWFRKDEDGKFLWPGFGDNIRVLKWIVERSLDAGLTNFRETPAGFLPGQNGLDLSGLDLSEANLEKALSVNPGEWKAELPDVEIFLKKFGDRIPGEIWNEFNKLSASL